MVILVAAGAVTGLGQLLVRRLASGNSIDITEAIVDFAGTAAGAAYAGQRRCCRWCVVGMGASLGREGAPKQAGAVIANALADRTALIGRAAPPAGRLRRRRRHGRGVRRAARRRAVRGRGAARRARAAADSAGAARIGMRRRHRVAAGDAERADLRDSLLLAVGIRDLLVALVAGPIVGVVLGGLRARHRVGGSPQARRAWLRLLAPIAALGLLGALSIAFPQLLGNGKDIAAAGLYRASGRAAAARAARAAALGNAYCVSEAGCREDCSRHRSRPARCSAACSGTAWTWLWPACRSGLFAIIGAAAVLAATTHGPLSSIVLVMELTGRDRSFILPMLLAVVTATVVARTLDCPLDLRCALHRSRGRRNCCRARAPRLGVEWTRCACSSSKMIG